ncbi:unnamed protein product [Urochloa humidicola]
MANFPVDPRPFVPPGFTLVPRVPAREPSRVRCFLAPSLVKENEDLAIAVTTPSVAKEDFGPFARELQRYLLDNGVRSPEIQMCPMGEAFVRFDSAMQREGFLFGGPRPFNGYQISFIRHDEGLNFRNLDLDRVVWLMLLCFPPDARRHVNLIDKSISAFASLLLVHKSTSESRLVIKALVNHDADVPDSVTVSTGSAPLASTWTVPIFVLNAVDVVRGGDEDPIPIDGPTHRMPNPAPGWMGPHGIPNHGNWVHESASVNRRSGGQTGNAAAQDQERDQPCEQGSEDVEVVERQPEQLVQSKLIGAAGEGHDLTLVQLHTASPAPAILKVIFPFDLSFIPLPIARNIASSLSLLDIDLDTIVASYVADHNARLFLATICHDQNKGVTVFGPARPLVPYSDDEDSDDDLMEVHGPIVKATPKKRRARKMREPLGAGFRRCSKRLNPDIDGFRSQESKTAAATFPRIYSGAADAQEPPAPHLSVEIAEGIVVGFLKMQPGVVSSAILEDLDE